MNTNNKKKVLGNAVVCFIVLFMALVMASCSAKPVNSVESAGKDEDGRDIYNVIIGDTVYQGLFLLDSCQGASKGTPMTVTVYGKAYSGPYVPILAVTRENRLQLFELERCDIFPPSIHTGDIDGDGQDEIVVDSAIFYRQHPLHVLKLKGDRLVELYRFPQYTDSPNVDITQVRDSISAESLNFGFVCRFEDGYKMHLEFPQLNFEEIIDISKYEFQELHNYYDWNGRLLESQVPQLRYNFFNSFELIDLDGDGACEIVGKQNIDLYSKEPLGYLEITLKYNTRSESMDVVAVDFTTLSESGDGSMIDK